MIKIETMISQAVLFHQVRVAKLFQGINAPSGWLLPNDLSTFDDNDVTLELTGIIIGNHMGHTGTYLYSIFLGRYVR